MQHALDWVMQEKKRRVLVGAILAAAFLPVVFGFIALTFFGPLAGALVYMASTQTIVLAELTWIICDS